MTASSAPTDKVFCQVAQPVYWSANDTPKTVAQIKEYNAVGKSLCGWGTPKPKPAPVTFTQRWFGK